jgi:hypothetical protein
VVTNCSGRAYSRTIPVCQAMNSAVCRAWKARQAMSYCRWALPSVVYRSAQVDRRCDQSLDRYAAHPAVIGFQVASAVPISVGR